VSDAPIVRRRDQSVNGGSSRQTSGTADELGFVSMRAAHSSSARIRVHLRFILRALLVGMVRFIGSPLISTFAIPVQVREGR
jgi:hypothetical protein